MARPTTEETRTRRNIIEDALVAGVSEREIAAIEVNGRRVFNAETLRSDLRKIRTKWLTHDTGWARRYHESRITTAKRYEAQLARLNRLLAEEATNMNITEIMSVERLISMISQMLHAVQCQIDPDVYLARLRESVSTGAQSARNVIKLEDSQTAGR